MKILVVLASVVCVVLCTGGRQEQDASTYPMYLKMAVDAMGVNLDSAANVEVLRVQTQV